MKKAKKQKAPIAQKQVAPKKNKKKSSFSLSNIVKYFFMGLFSPIIVMENQSKLKKVKQKKHIVEGKGKKEEKKQYKDKINKLLTIEKKQIQKIEKEVKPHQRALRNAEIQLARAEQGYKKLLTSLEKEKMNHYKSVVNSAFSKQHKKILAIHRNYMMDAKKTEQLNRNFLKKIESADERKRRKEREKQERIRLAKEKRQKKIEAIYKREKEKEEEAYREKKKREEKKQAKLERRAKIKKQRQDVYVNDKVIPEKPKKKSAFEKLLAAIGAIPKTIVNKFKNNIFARNARNRRDMNRQALLIDFEGDDAKRSDIKLVYEYQAKTPEGKFVTGHFEAFSKVEVHSFLLSEGYEVYKIQTNKWITMKYARASSARKKFKRI